MKTLALVLAATAFWHVAATVEWMTGSEDVAKVRDDLAVEINAYWRK